MHTLISAFILASPLHCIHCFVVNPYPVPPYAHLNSGLLSWKSGNYAHKCNQPRLNSFMLPGRVRFQTSWSAMQVTPSITMSEVKDKTAIDATIIERPLLTFSGNDLKRSLDMFESFDDQIMGGISQSTLKPGTFSGTDEECAVFSGVVRVEGGGFVGNRMKLLAEPLDLSAYTGLYLKVRGDGKIYKINLRTGLESRIQEHTSHQYRLTTSSASASH